jgi:endonuclease/exonuclease/phosphatase family metal-dependent hydrolase
MTRLRSAVLLAALGASGCATVERNYIGPGPVYTGAHAGAPSADDEIRVVTYNIEYGKRTPAAIDALQARPELRDPDVLLLQEMDAPGVAAVAEALSLNYVYYPSSRTPKTHRDVGTAILTPWPIERSHKIQLPHLARLNGHARAVTSADVRIAGRVVRVYSVHFGTLIGLSGRQRRDQLEAVIAHAADAKGPVIIGGDFNGKSSAARLASRGYSWPTRDVGKTAELFVLRFSFDHVLALGLEPAPAPASGVVHGVRNVSDHRPVWASFAVPVH